MVQGRPRRSNQLTFLDKAKILLVFIPIPIVLVWYLAQSFWSEKDRHKSWKRILLDNISVYISSNLSRRQASGINSRTTTLVYSDFMDAQGLSQVVQELGDDARLFWYGPRQADRVILYFHGGAFLFPSLASAPYFLHHAQINLKNRGTLVDITMLNYTLVPEAIFPVQLRQAVLAIQHLLHTGVQPENIQLVGDSAGGALIHQVLSHILHPVEDVPKLTLSGPLSGAYMMSPWVCLTNDPVVRNNQGRGDLLTLSTSVYWGSKVLRGIPQTGMPYLSAVSAPEDWFNGIEKVVKRVLISAGDLEVIRDAIVRYAGAIKKYHTETTLFVEERGVHCEPLLAFLTKDEDLGKLTPFVVDWLDKGFST